MKQFVFGDIVLVENGLIGVVVKNWYHVDTKKFTYEVYVRYYSSIGIYEEEEVEEFKRGV